MAELSAVSCEYIEVKKLHNFMHSSAGDVVDDRYETEKIKYMPAR
jgi:hypothetical protein